MPPGLENDTIIGTRLNTVTYDPLYTYTTNLGDININTDAYQPLAVNEYLKGYNTIHCSSPITEYELNKRLDDFAHKLYWMIKDTARIDVDEDEFMRMLHDDDNA